MAPKPIAVPVQQTMAIMANSSMRQYTPLPSVEFVGELNRNIIGHMTDLVAYVNRVVNLLMLSSDEDRESKVEELFNSQTLLDQSKKVAAELFSLDSMTADARELRTQQISQLVPRLLYANNQVCKHSAQESDAYVAAADFDPKLAFLTKAVLVKPLLLAQASSMLKVQQKVSTAKRDGDRGAAPNLKQNIEMNNNSRFVASFLEKADDPRIMQAFYDEFENTDDEVAFSNASLVAGKLSSIDDKQAQKHIVDKYMSCYDDDDSDKAIRLANLIANFDVLEYDTSLYDALIGMLVSSEEMEKRAGMTAFLRTPIDGTLFEHHEGFSYTLDSFIQGGTGRNRSIFDTVFSSFIMSRVRNLAGDFEDRLIALLKDPEARRFATAIIPGYVNANKYGLTNEMDIRFVNRIQSAIYKLFPSLDDNEQGRRTAWVLMNLLKLLPITEKTVRLHKQQYSNCAEKFPMQMEADRMRLAKNSDDEELREEFTETVAQAYDTMREDSQPRTMINTASRLLIMDPEQIVPLIRTFAEQETPGLNDFLMRSIMRHGVTALHELAGKFGELGTNPRAHTMALSLMELISMDYSDFFDASFNYSMGEAIENVSIDLALNKITANTFLTPEDYDGMAYSLLNNYHNLSDENKVIAHRILARNYKHVKDSIVAKAKPRGTEAEALCEEILRAKAYTPALAA